MMACSLSVKKIKLISRLILLGTPLHKNAVIGQLIGKLIALIARIKSNRSHKE